MLENSESWLPITGFEGHYEVSDQGRVRGLDRFVMSHSDNRTRRFKGRILRPEIRHGYHVVQLSKDGQRHKEYVHRLVLFAFVGEPPEGAECCHNNDIRTDNRLENLRWDTHQANVGDALSRGRLRSIRHYNGDRTHCHRGHPFDEENTLIRSVGRSCRECRRMTERARYHRKKSS